jgi:hypothetical protein
MPNRVRSGFNATVDGATLGLATVAVGPLVLCCIA